MNNKAFQRQVATNLKEHLEKFKLVFSGRRFGIRSFQEASHIREVVVHPGAVIILPLLDDQTIIMIQNERFAVGETLWELPAGTIEPNELTDTTAARELIEESGYQAGEIEPLISFYTSPGICNEAMYAYVARRLEFVGQKLDSTENITTKAIPWLQVLEMIKSGEIRDGKTIATLLYFHSFKGKEA